MVLDSICEFIVDTKHKTPPFVNDGHPCIRTPNIGRGYFILENAKYVSDKTFEEWTSRATPSENDLILAREAPVGNVAIIPAGLKVCHGQRTVLMRPDASRVNPHYLMYLLLGDEMQHKMNAQASGATVPHLNMKDIRELQLPKLPDRDYQDKIAAVLSAYDDLIENNNRRIAIIEEMARRLHREWFVKFRFPGHEEIKMINSELGKIPEGWEVKRVGELVEYRRDSIPKGTLPEPIPYMGLEHMPRRSIALSNWDMETEIGSTKLKFQAGDILFGKIRPYFHKVGVAQVDGVCSSDTFVLRPKQNYHALATCIASSDDFVAHSVQTSQGTKMPRANWDVLKDYKVPFPTNDLLVAFEKSVNPMNEMIGRLSAKNRNLREQRDMLLPKLISGKIELSKEP